MSSDFEHKGSTRRHCPWQTSRTAHTSPLFCSARAHAAPASSAWCTCAGASGGTSTVTRGSPRSLSSLQALAGRGWVWGGGGGDRGRGGGEPRQEPPPAPAAGGDAANRLVGVQLELAVGGQHAAVAPVEAREVGKQAHAR